MTNAASTSFPRNMPVLRMPDATSPNGRAYAAIEGFHARQWAIRLVVPLAALATNASGRIDIPALPRFDAPDLGRALEAALPWVGAALVLCAAGVRIAAKGVLVRRTTLTTGGVYGVLRHPFYLANLVGAVGTFLLAGPLGAVLAVVWTLAAAPIYWVTIAAEDRALARLYPEAHEAWAKRVRALVPWVPPQGTPGAPVTWAGLVAEREPPRLVRFLAGAAIVFGLTLTGPASLVVLGGAALAFAGSYCLR